MLLSTFSPSRLRLLFVMVIAFTPSMVCGQSWQDVYESVMTITGDDDGGEEMVAESYEMLEQLALTPIDLNSASRDDLEQLPFLSSQQVMDIMEYLDRYGPMRSLGELRMVSSLDHVQLSLLPFFVRVGDGDDQLPSPKVGVDSLLRSAKSSVTATLRVPLYSRRGDDGGYMGYPYRHTLRYELSSGKRLRAGIIGAQDAGEPFFKGGNSMGYDAYSYYVQLRQYGCLENIVAGKFKLSAGMGLVFGQSFQLGKLASLQSLGRTVQTIRPHSSRSESDYFRGVAATVRLMRHERSSGNIGSLSLSAFASHRPIDATLTADGAARTLITSGYHRTPTEMEKKGNTHIVSGGTHLTYTDGGLRLGITAVASRLDRELLPDRSSLFRRHYAHGRHFFNASADYAFTHHRFAISGETATDGHGAMATINSVSLLPSARLGVMAQQRFYSFRYTTLYGHSFADGTQTQNESGIYVGATWNPLAHLSLQGYADYAYFPWARYLVSQSSHSCDLLLQATYSSGHVTLTARHRTRLREKDNEARDALVDNNDLRSRLTVAYQNRGLTMKTQLDLAHAHYLSTSRGWMAGEQATLTTRRAQVTAMAAYFNTDSYDSRIYVYERQLQHEFYFPVFYGEGIRLAFQARTDIGKRLRIAARIGYTNYFDRSTIGTSLQHISHSHQTDIDLQMRWKF